MIVTPPFTAAAVVFLTGTAGGFRLLGGGAGAVLLCLGTGELGREDADDADPDDPGRVWSIPGPVGENGELATTRISGGSCVNGASSSILGRRSDGSEMDDEGSSTSIEPARSRLRLPPLPLGKPADAAATRGRLVELSLLPIRIASTPRLSFLKFSAL